MGLCFTKEREITVSSSSEVSPSPSGQPCRKTLQQQKLQNRYRPSSAPHLARILSIPTSAVTSYYTIERELGRGHFGITYLCTEKSTGLKFACKSIPKRNLVTRDDVEDIKREINIMQHLTGQPNIVELKGVYEDRTCVHLVMELCSGGELFDRIIAHGNYSEREAARIGRAIVNVVHACHFMGVIHRDLKPENFLLVSREEHSELKATDFGLSVFIEEGRIWR